ncbi:transcription initiation factor TFIID subunit 12-like isoform X2 [Amaranthus tricolor]|uniref:transcription initiation factor TFIID subunit 12-like isoform X2 n=1 Tax=Amaranthus tricolor TaxID=29722 RepID=UPI0025832E85|nr:transcription initiation factor TFIID subunit 12-like isoform X2 [Amaranthus tricolor]
MENSAIPPSITSSKPSTAPLSTQNSQYQSQQPQTISRSSPISIPNPNFNTTNFPQRPTQSVKNISRSPFNTQWTQPTSQFSNYPSQFHSSSFAALSAAASSSSRSSAGPAIHGMPNMRRTGVSSSAPHQTQPFQATSGRRPSQSAKPLLNPQSLQQRSYIPQKSVQQLQAAAPPPQKSLPLPQQQQRFPVSNQSQDKQLRPSSRASQTSANQHVRVQGSANQGSPRPAIGQASIARSEALDSSNAADISKACSTVLGKRNIKEILNQIDPSEKLHPEAEDALIDIAEDFIDSITSFACSLAKHRKSNMLEAKDILLHIDRDWNMTLPGFGGDEVRTCKKPVANDIHSARLALTNKSFAGEKTGIKISTGPTTENVKGHLVKATTDVVVS